MIPQTLTACPIVADVPALIEFLTHVFGARQKVGAIGSHAEIQIGDTNLMIGGGDDAKPMAFHIYVPDVDAAYHRAIGEGADSLVPPTDQEWGECTANIKDPAGNLWYIATFQGENYFSEGAPTIQPFLQPLHCEPLIVFLVNAFGAIELGRAADASGAILHTTLKIGGSALEMFDANGLYQPMPGMFHLYATDADAIYKKAVQHGAVPVSATAVKDCAGNTWNIVQLPG